jgi:hypothetical protein
MMNRHAEWIAAASPAMLEGDVDALAEIRRATFLAQGLPVDEEAPVYLWNGVWVKGDGDESHAVPDRVRAAFVRTPPPPGMPSAIWPEGLPRPGEIERDDESSPIVPERSRREKLLDLSLGVAEGEERAIQELVQRTRRHHEVVPDMFPTEVEAHWFETGIMLVGPGHSPQVFQSPMSQLGDMIEPRAYPLLPLIRMPKGR